MTNFITKNITDASIAAYKASTPNLELLADLAHLVHTDTIVHPNDNPDAYTNEELDFLEAQGYYTPQNLESHCEPENSNCLCDTPGCPCYPEDTEDFYVDYTEMTPELANELLRGNKKEYITLSNEDFTNLCEIVDDHRNLYVVDYLSMTPEMAITLLKGHRKEYITLSDEDLVTLKGYKRPSKVTPPAPEVYIEDLDSHSIAVLVTLAAESGADEILFTEALSDYGVDLEVLLDAHVLRNT